MAIDNRAMLHRFGSKVLAATALVASLTMQSPTASAGESASSRRLVSAGLGMAIPSYWLGVTVHEGSHALLAKLFGAEVLELRLWPGRHPRTGTFFFGWTSYRGQLTDGQKTVFFLAPKIADLLLLGTFVALQASDSLPRDDYASLAITVMATGSWVDFSKDIIAFQSANDVMRVHAMYGNDREIQRLPWRLLHAGLSAAAGFFIVREYAAIFDEPTAASAFAPPRVLSFPLWRSSF